MENLIDISVLFFIPKESKQIRMFLDSILKQTHSNMELIVCSEEPDGTVKEIVQSYTTDPRVTYLIIHENNKFKFFNKASKIAKGRYITYLDTHVKMESCCLEKLWHFLETNPTVLAVGSDNILMPTNTYQAMPHSQKEIELNLLKNEEFKPSVFLVRADSFKRLNGFNEAYIKYADYDFLCRLVLLGTVSNLPDALSYCICEDEYEEKGNLDEYINIQRIYQLNFINTHLRINQKAVTKNEISSMNLGLIISYYTYSYYYQEDLYSKIADQLLDDTSSSLSTSMPVTLSNGILGFACGIIYLIRNQFIEGDEDEILSEIDNMLYRVLIEFEEENQVDWYGWIYYSKQRLSFSTLQKRGLPGIIYQQNFIYMLDCLSRAIQKNIRLPKDILPEIEWMHAKKICPVTTKKNP